MSSVYMKANNTWKVGDTGATSIWFKTNGTWKNVPIQVLGDYIYVKVNNSWRIGGQP